MAQINIRVADDVKNRAEEACSEMGLSLSEVINVYLIKIGREKKIPFEISTDSFYSDENMNRLCQSIADVEAGRSTFKEHDLIEE